VSERLGVAGVVAALSVTSDLTRGHPRGEAMRACLLATELARRAELSSAAQAEVYYATLMRFAGCAATSHEAAAALGGDDIAVRARGDLIDPTRPVEALRFLAGLGHGPEKVRVLARTPRVPKIVQESARADCEVGADLAGRLRLPEGVRRAVLCASSVFRREVLRPGSRAGAPGGALCAVGFAAVMFDAVGGAEAAAEAVAGWSGRALDPAVAAIFLAAPAELVELSDPEDVWAAVVDSEPQPPRLFRDHADLDGALAGFGDAADLKSPFFQGHSRGVALLVRAACGAASLDPVLAYRAGLVHDLGRVAVPTGLWEQRRALRADEWELVRLHPYHSARILARSPVLEPLSAIVSRHHERVDGTGYPAGVRAGESSEMANLLAAADVWHALGEARPHRPAFTAVQAARVIAEMPLDRDALRAVLAAAAPAAAFHRYWWTSPSVSLLRLLSAGHTKRQIAHQLFISTSTVHTHTVHIYAKCEVSTRAGLAMFAMRHGLVGTR
jgi:HD-GYP domain-containing protein (c-di-GMP phosphodiesterase class II)/DNA-binding CsgD family transcriptional regulator